MVDSLIKRPFACGACNRRFGTKGSVRDHAKATHLKCPRIYIFECVEVIRTPDDEPSIASQVIDAYLDRAMGNPVADWLGDMIDD